MESVDEFLAYACKLEQEAVLRFKELAEAAKTHGNKEVADFFAQMAHYSQMHYQQAKERCGFHDLPEMKPQDFQWPEMESPEAAAIWGADPLMGVQEAMRLALDAETRGYEFYKSILDSTSDPEIRAMAQEFTEEEAEHVEAIQRWIVRLAA
ncbi:ferritin family protein [Magnetospirillum sp. 64-120]|uniref:ferritin-like domain-containing protein n=1 Tax=Magnetospirillum sp. 64-120 TaxID=1895778 RepID=UPI00092865A5|nr:ferritin family protein [Magnetospirillum sp. 64-120]OJX78507.1 MAG: rubrerythrin [Magnetospirillum sp. 64-120]